MTRTIPFVDKISKGRGNDAKDPTHGGLPFSVSKLAPKSVTYSIARSQEFKIIRENSNLFGIDVFQIIPKNSDLLRSTESS